MYFLSICVYAYDVCTAMYKNTYHVHATMEWSRPTNLTQTVYIFCM